MKIYFKLSITAFCLLMFSCSGSDDSDDDNSGGGGIDAQATYRITFTTNFTAIHIQQIILIMQVLGRFF